MMADSRYLKIKSQFHLCKLSITDSPSHRKWYHKGTTPRGKKCSQSDLEKVGTRGKTTLHDLGQVLQNINLQNFNQSFY